MLLIEGLRSLQRPTYLQMPIGVHHHQLRSLDLVGQLTTVTLHQPQLAMPQGAGVGPSLLDPLSPLPYAVSPAREVFTMGGDTTTSPYHAN